ncbi:hypothetical protein N431DRAFT_437561 [Stipitochalara longipes BDJ]|nr:hypothetical protein N431DRAFT_437561 [Stipitochalara longipes BDJ]
MTGLLPSSSAALLRLCSSFFSSSSNSAAISAILAVVCSSAFCLASTVSSSTFRPGSSSGVAFLFLFAERLPYQNAKKTRLMNIIAPSAAPTPIPALAPVERPWLACGAMAALCDADALELVVEEEGEDDVDVESEGELVDRAAPLEDADEVLVVTVGCAPAAREAVVETAAAPLRANCSE